MGFFLLPVAFFLFFFFLMLCLDLLHACLSNQMFPLICVHIGKAKLGRSPANQVKARQHKTRALGHRIYCMLKGARDLIVNQKPCHCKWLMFIFRLGFVVGFVWTPVLWVLVHPTALALAAFLQFLIFLLKPREGLSSWARPVVIVGSSLSGLLW